ncbi:MAG: SusD/RagB family nutrient-binding outer membrane lipoprotein [Chitinophagaceae bacterium]|nr:SusD/RagB family nutrient-binding outer membrane lipoprotein [Chitinophagaceae bacterium]
MKSSFIKIALPLLLLITGVGCKKYLNINSDPDTTQNPSNSSVFPAMLSGIPRGVQYDARYLGKYTQNWLSSANGNNDTWDRHGYIANSDASGDIWRQTYFGLGGNLEYIIKNGQNKKQYDYVGAALTLKALMFQMCTDYHGEIIYSEAFKEGVYYFNFDEQEVVYRGVDSLCRDAINYLTLAETAGGNTLAVGDFAYNGDITKWKKLTYAIMAKNFHRITNKPNYSADSVIKYVDLSFSSVNDDFVLPFDASKNDDSNFFGPYRNNLSLFRQSNYIVRLLDGTTMAGGSLTVNRDPRMAHMLSASQDTTNGNGGYRGVDPALGDPFSATTTGTNARKRVATLWGDSTYANPSSAVFTPTAGKFLFKDKVVMPVSTYSEMMFTKAEAAFKKGDKVTAYTAYTAGINAHFDFINRNYSGVRGNANLYNVSPISASQRTAYLNTSGNVKASAATLTVTDIMLQKYIALWGWGWVETWNDLRRYHYIDMDGDTGDQVFKGFVLPATYFANNLNKPAYRFRPRYNSEYVWNLDQLRKLGADKLDYHTYETWFSKP